MILKVPKGENPYTVIGNHIRDNVKVIEDMIVTIEINGSRMNELFEAYPTEEGYFIWESDWWEGEEDIALIDFFPVSEACSPKTFIPFEWTPCSERLPEEVGTYLVTINYHGNTYVCMDNFHPSGWGWDAIGFTRLAWAKVPEPYKGETE